MAVREVVYNDITYSISYEIVNPTFKKTVVFLHGWGSNKEIMKQAFGSELKEYKHIYLDMPGFGASSIEKVITTEDYAHIVKLFLDSLHVDADTFLGHSFGGKVATLLEPKNLILLSSAGIVIEKSLKVKTKIKSTKIANKLGLKFISNFFRTKDADGMSQTMYEILKGVVNEDFTDKFSTTDSKSLIFWGKEDKDTPLSSGETISKLIKNSKFYPLNGDHFFFIKNAKYIAKSIDEEL